MWWMAAILSWGNDNNFPFSSSREPNVADDNEFILLDVKALLQP
ncbi:Uncharacterised protein [Serratia fonticola]|uniref:Uncharacterized protein n=1 Tax=Serratia fonticola TaxID=47917 RepID=A0A4V6KSS7_SERFO|nr:Uncharacterised protein [Serratia fonticola]